jgi:hypothetical protein
MNKLFQKVDMVIVLRVAGLFLLALYLLQGFMNAGRGAQVDDMLKIFVISLANGVFQPLVLLGVAEIINGQRKK